MAPASASPQPPSGRPDETGYVGQKAATRRDGQDQEAQGQYTDYGPLSVERHLKQDGRALILYARLESQDR
jgi:hypothetical protein